MHALLLLLALLLVALAVWRLTRKQWIVSGVCAAIAVAALAWFFTSDEVPEQFVSFAPHLTTLLVLALAAQRLRPPAADGIPYRRGQE